MEKKKKVKKKKKIKLQLAQKKELRHYPVSIAS